MFVVFVIVKDLIWWYDFYLFIIVFWFG